ncbi:hypothetical protein BKA82DRAFT_4014297 [Pisolithus tinctorius]|nr:hypothetical protein BKA82DRAFT_4014297 [Pisolithus tinctorius]
MPKRTLRNLKNLGAYASGVTKRTHLSVAYQTKKLKENVAPHPHTLAPTPRSPLFNADLLLQAASILDEINTTSGLEEPLLLQTTPNDIIFLTTADEDFEDLRSADAEEVAEEPLYGLDEEDDNASVQEDDELFGPAENSPIMDTSWENGAHQGSTLPVGNGEFAWELRKPPSVESATEALCNLKTMLKPHRATGRGYRDPDWMGG